LQYKKLPVIIKLLWREEANITALKRKKIGARRGLELDNQQDVFKAARSSIPIMKEVLKMILDNK